MKDLGKLLTILSLPILSFLNPIQSKAQEFLPGKFNGYQTKSDTVYYPKFVQFTEEGDIYISKFYDIEKDGIEDVIEVYLVDKIREKDSLSLKMRENPILYIFQIEKDVIMLVDPKQNGLQKEDFNNRKEGDMINEGKGKYLL